ncbi:hypothetical protein HY229_01110 [Candidatus Acetothermia bacterium]|nr:hypothetical protein [Candidatus Acetothermia bacterium]MBI3642690.1 hypothetical protein [Candidatus Acetothermia bacterium]
MFFKYGSTVFGLEITLRSEEKLIFDLRDSQKVLIALWRPSESEIRLGHSKDVVLAEVSSQCTISPENGAIFACLKDRKVPEKVLDKNAWHEYLDSSGRVKEDNALPLELMPLSFQEISGQVLEDLTDAIRRTVYILRWRSSASCVHNPISTREFLWSDDGNRWYYMPRKLSLDVTVSHQPSISERLHKDIVDLLKAGFDEPIGRVLFREAWSQRYQNPRSSLVIGMSAAESGVKQCISQLAPSTKWLIENLPSPPISLILRKYLPDLETRLKIKGRVFVPKYIIDLVEEGTKLRNKVAHLGAKPPHFEKLKEILLSINDLLWLLDYYCGFEWTMDQISQKTRQEIDHS